MLMYYFSSDALEPFCGTYAFAGDITLFNCMATSLPIQDVKFLNDLYITAIAYKHLSRTVERGLRFKLKYN